QSAIRNPQSEAVPDSEPDLPFRIEGRAVVVGDRRDLPEISGGEVPARIREHSRVEDVTDLDAGLEAPLGAHREDSEHRQIEIVAAGAVELVSGRVAELDALRL